MFWLAPFEDTLSQQISEVISTTESCPVRGLCAAESGVSLFLAMTVIFHSLVTIPAKFCCSLLLVMRQAMASSSRSSSPWSSPPSSILSGHASIPPLLGRSNFPQWRSYMTRILQEDVQARTLIFHNGSDIPGNFPSPSAISKPTNTPPVEGISSIPNGAHQKSNLEVCRFIRSTLAMNVAPFVRGQTSAKALWQQLNLLYGDQTATGNHGGRSTTSYNSLDRKKKAPAPSSPNIENSSDLVCGDVHSTMYHKAPGPPIPVIVIAKPKQVAFDTGHTRPSASAVLRSHTLINDANLSPALASDSDLQAGLTIPRSVLYVKSSSLPLSARRPSHPPRLHFDIDQSFTQERKAASQDLEETAAAGIEMKSLLLGKDYETPGLTPTPDSARARSRDYFQR